MPSGSAVSRKSTQLGFLTSVFSFGEKPRLRKEVAALKMTVETLKRNLAELHQNIVEREKTVIEREHAVVEKEALIRELEIELRRAESNLADLKTVRAGSFARLEEVSVTPSASSVFASNGSLAPAAAIARWRTFAETLERIEGAQRPLDEPYVLEQVVNGATTRLLIATGEGRDWYDKFSYNETPHLQYLGMIREGSVVFDCGANHGVNSLAYSAIVGEAGKVVSFDPFPANIEIAKINAEMNGRENISFVQKGLSSIEETVVVSVNEQCVELEDKNARDTLTITLDRLDNFAHLKPDLIKIDIEGAEIDALEGASKILKSRPSLYIEIHPGFLPRFGKAPMDMFRYVKFEEYDFYLNHAGLAPLSPYAGEFEIVEGCAIFCVPKDARIGPRRYI